MFELLRHSGLRAMCNFKQENRLSILRNLPWCIIHPFAIAWDYRKGSITSNVQRYQYLFLSQPYISYSCNLLQLPKLFLCIYLALSIHLISQNPHFNTSKYVTAQKVWKIRGRCVVRCGSPEVVFPIGLSPQCHTTTINCL